MSEGPRPKETPKENLKKSGFEYEGEFIAWHLTDKVVDLQLVDHFAQMPPAEFFLMVEDDFDRERSPIVSAMIATSLRHRYQNWSRDRIIRFVENISMGQLIFFDGDEPEGGEEETHPTDSTSDDVEATKASSKKSKGQADTT